MTPCNPDAADASRPALHDGEVVFDGKIERIGGQSDGRVCS